MPIICHLFSRLLLVYASLLLALSLPALAGPSAPSGCGASPGGAPCGGSGPASQGNASATNQGAGNPINVINGNKYQQEIDLPALPGVLGLEIVRHYNSAYSGANAPNGILGRGWKLSYETELYALGTSLQIVQADGTRLIFNRDPERPGLCASDDPAQGKILIRRTPRGEEYTWIWANGRRLDFDSQGKLVQILAPTGEFVSLQRDARGLLVKVTDPQGRSLILSYLDPKLARAGDRFRGVQHIDSPVGRFTYAYGSLTPQGSSAPKTDLLANLIKVSLPTHYDAATKSFAYANRGITSSSISRIYHYEDPRHPTLLTGITVSGIGSDGQLINQRLSTYQYDQEGRGILSVRGVPKRLGKDGHPIPGGDPSAALRTGIEQVKLSFPAPGKTLLSNSLGQTTTYTHAVIGEQARLLEVRGAGCASCNQANVKYTYDRLGRMSGETQLTPTAEPIRTTRTDRDAQGRPVRISTITYHNGHAQPARLQVRYAYAPIDTRNPQDPEPVADQPILIARPSVIPGQEHQIRITYNPSGQPTRVTETGWTPGQGGAPPTPLTRTTIYSYTRINGRSLLAQIDGPLANGPTPSPADSDITRYTWDKRGSFVTQITYPMNRSVSLTYDEAGRTSAVTRQFDAVVQRTLYQYAPRSQVEQRSEQILSSDRTALLAARIITSTYNARDQLAQITWPDHTSTRIGYTAAGQVQPVALPDGRMLAFNAATAESLTAPPTPDTSVPALHASFGATGSAAQNAVLKFEAQGKTAQRLIDDFGRVVAIQNPNQAWQSAAYDAANRLTQVTDPRGARTQARYDLADRLIEVQRTAPGSSRPEQTLRLTWSASNKTEEAVYAGTQLTHRTVSRYTLWGQLASQQVMIGAGQGNVVSLSQQLHYSLFGKLLSRTLPDGTRIAYRYYADTPSEPGTSGQLAAIEQIHWPSGLDWLMARLPESWQPKTVLAQLAPNSQATPQPGNAPPVSVLGDAGAPQVQIAPGLSPDAPGEQFDSAGLPHRLTTATGQLQLLWNAAGQLAQVSAASGKTIATYRYDAQGRRASKTTAHGSEFYLYEGTQLIATAADGNGPEKNPSPIHITGQYLYQGYRPVAWLKPQRDDGLWHTLRAWINWSDTTAYALATDHRGAVLAVTTLATDPAQRKTLWQSHINAWGAVQASASTMLDPKLRLVNQYADAETGLSYNLARYYDPAQGRFISPDPAGIADSIDHQTPDSLKLDITVYASGQPYLYFDPDAAAKIRYYAITTGTSGQALGTTQGFTKARWAFQITGIQAGGDASTLGQLRNQYAQNGTSLLFDGGGNFVSGFNVIDSIKSPDGQSIRWDASSSDNVVQSFGIYYDSNLISISQFTINTVDDNNATNLIRYLSSTQQDRAKCKASAPGWLPEVKFAAEEVPIKVILPANGDASKQRILACVDGSNTNLDQRRIAKYEAAAEINETRSPKEINKDCSSDGCPGVIYYCTTSNCVGQYSAPTTATTYIASYGRSQFIGATLVSELISAYGTFTAAEKAAIGLTPTMKTLLDAAVVRATKLSAWWSTIPAAASYAAASTTWDSLPPSQQATFNSDTGLGERAYEDIVRMKTSPPTNSKGTSLLSDAKQGFITSAIMSDVTLANFLMGIFKDFDKFTIMSQALMRKNMNLVLSKFPNASEEEIAGRVARLHNGGPGSNWDAASFTTLTSSDAFNYVKRFLGWSGYKSEGDWYSLRCTESLGNETLKPGTQGKGIGGLQMTPLKLN